MALSKSQNGVYCLACALMNRSSVKQHFVTGQNRALTFVSEPLSSFKKISGSKDNNKLLNHELSQDHRLSILKLSEFKSTHIKEKKSISDIFTTQSKDEKQKLESALITIFRATLFLAKQNLPLRGHREELLREEENNDQNYGNMMYLTYFMHRNYD